MTLILALESSCDETACAIIKDGKEILSNIVSSQINVHTQYGGAVSYTHLDVYKRQVLGLANGIRIVVLNHDVYLAIVVSVSIIVTVMISKFVGCVLPIIAKRLKTVSYTHLSLF